MTTSAPTAGAKQNSVVTWLRANWALIGLVAALVALPFIIGLANGDSIADVLANESGNSKFIQGLLIEVFILAVFAISYDLVLGITGLLSFGHAMFFAVGAYLTGILLKNLEWSLLPTILAVAVAGVVQALLFSVVLPRVKGITFALVTLGMASVFAIMIGTREAAPYTGADVGLQGIPRPALLDPVARLRFYLIMLAFAVAIYLLYRRFVDSPTGRVCIAIRENEDRARMLWLTRNRGTVRAVRDQRFDRLVAQAVEIDRLPVVEHAIRIVLVVELLDVEIGPPPAQVGDRRAKRTRGPDGALSLLDRPGVHADKNKHRLAPHLLGKGNALRRTPQHGQGKEASGAVDMNSRK